MKYFKRELAYAHGIDELDILRFFQEVEAIGSQLHSFILLRHGVVVAESHKYPYHSDCLRLLHSGSKTYTALAIGFAVQEERLTIDDRVIDFFPEYKSDTVDEKMKHLSIKHLLHMSTGFDTDSIFSITSHEDWVKSFFSLPMKEMPGTRFLYDSGATFMLSAVITKITGQSIDEYLKPRLFDPLEITDVVWDKKNGINTGGWGLMLKPEDFAKLGVLFLEKGCFNGKHILNETWILEASSKQIETGSMELRPNWAQGYCFQMWRGNLNTFRADGAFGQFCIISPDHDIVVVMTSEDGNSQGLLCAFEEQILIKVQDSVLAPDAIVHEKLSKLLINRSKPLVYDATVSYLENILSTSKFELKYAENIFEAKFDFQNEKLIFTLGSQQITSSKLAYHHGFMSCVLEPLTFITYFNERIWAYAAHHHWVNDNTLIIEMFYTETAHRQQLIVEYQSDKIRIRVVNGLKNLLGIANIPNIHPLNYEDVLIDGILLNDVN